MGKILVLAAAAAAAVFGWKKYQEATGGDGADTLAESAQRGAGSAKAAAVTAVDKAKDLAGTASGEVAEQTEALDLTEAGSTDDSDEEAPAETA